MKQNDHTILPALLGIEPNTEYNTIDERRPLLVSSITEAKHLPMLRMGQFYNYTRYTFVSGQWKWRSSC